MTEQQAKALTILDEAYKQSKKGVGDYQRTKDSLANTERRLNEQMKEVGETVGKLLIPIFTGAATSVADFFRALTETDLDETIRQLEEYGAAAEVVAKAKANQELIESLEDEKDLRSDISSLLRDLPVSGSKFLKITKEQVGEFFRFKKLLSDIKDGTISITVAQEISTRKTSEVLSKTKELFDLKISGKETDAIQQEKNILEDEIEVLSQLILLETKLKSQTDRRGKAYTVLYTDLEQINKVASEFPNVSANDLFESLKASNGEAEALRLTLLKFPEFIIPKPDDNFLKFGKDVYLNIKGGFDEANLSTENLNANFTVTFTKVKEITKEINRLGEIIKKGDLTPEEAFKIWQQIELLSDRLDFSKMNEPLDEAKDKLKQQAEFIENIITARSNVEDQIELINEKLTESTLTEAEINDLLLKRVELLNQISDVKPPEPPSFADIGGLDLIGEEGEKKVVVSFVTPEGEQPEDFSFDELEDSAERVGSSFKLIEDSTDNVDNKFASIAQAGVRLGSILKLGADTFVGKLIDGMNQAVSIADSIFGIISAFTGGSAGGIFGLLFGKKGGTFQDNTKTQSFAQGGTAKVPPGFSNDSFPVMVSSGEILDVTPKGEVPKREKAFQSVGESINEMQMRLVEAGIITGGTEINTSNIKTISDALSMVKTSVSKVNEMKEQVSTDRDREEVIPSERNKSVLVNLNRDIPKLADGGAFTVPATGISGDSYPILLKEGEHVNITKGSKVPDLLGALKKIEKGINNLIVNTISAQSGRDITIPLLLDGKKIAEAVYFDENRGEINSREREDFR